MKECPKCHRFTVRFDSYFKRLRCMMRDCGWISKYFVRDFIRDKEE